MTYVILDHFYQPKKLSRIRIYVLHVENKTNSYRCETNTFFVKNVIFDVYILPSVSN